MRKLFFSRTNEIGVIRTLPLFLIMAAVGVISFLLLTSTIPLGGLFGRFNPKPESRAAPITSPVVTPSPVATNAVNIVNFAFSPQVITVPVGTTVTWTNNAANTNHTVTSDSGLFDSGTIAGGGKFSFKFNTAGTFSYHCSLHPAMTADVIVTAAPIPGDIDLSGKVDIFDYNILVGNFNKTGTGIQGDLDGSGKVDIFDYNILVTNFGRTS